MRLAKKEVLPGVVASSNRHAFAHEQEIHGLVSVSALSLGRAMDAAQLEGAAA